MAQYDLPNNKKLNVPDNLDPALREKLAGAIQRQFGIDINETTVLGQAAETLKGIPRGAVGTALGIPLGAASLFDVGNDSDLVQGLRQYQEFLNTESSLAADPAYRDQWLTKLGEGIGSFAPFLGAGKVGQILKARGIGGTGFANPMFTVPAAMAVPSGISQQADRVNASRQLGEDVGGVAETFAELGGGLVGVTEVLPIFNLFKRVPKNALQYSDIRRKLSSALQSGAAEGLQEVSASLAQDLIARGLYSDELPIGDSLFDEFTIGGAVGALADLGVNALSGRSKGRQYLYDREEKARNNLISLEEENKFQKAQIQGEVEELTNLEPVKVPEIPLPPSVAPGPRLEVIQDASEKYSVVDLDNIESPVIEQFDTETKALNFKNKQETNYERKKLKVNLDNATYSLGMPKSGEAYRVGATINDPNTSQVNLQTLVNFDSTLSKEQKKLFSKERMEAGFRGKNPYAEMIERKKEHLQQIGKYVKSKGLDLKASYTMPEMKKVLNTKDYNMLLSDLANTVFQRSEKDGIPSITADKELPNVNLKYIKDIAASKNIELDFKSPAVRYAALQWTGTSDISKTRNRGVKELFLARLHSLYGFNNKTQFPDFRPRKYNAQDVANFVASAGSQNVEFSADSLLKDGVTANDKAATEQFIDDLVTSGRAEKINGTSKYKIRPNHQFDIARRAEGFNETPQEFGNRLREENELPEEAIASLVEQERQRQRHLLPPDEIDKKIVNFDEAVREGRTNKFAKELKKQLDKAGLRETGLVVSNDILSTSNLIQTPDGEIKFDPSITRATEQFKAVEGEYDQNTDIIFLSLNAVNPDGMATDSQILERLNQVLDHEMIHAFREKDLINEKEYQFLRKEVKRRKVPSTYDAQYKTTTFYQRAKNENIGREDLKTATTQRKEELYVEEAIAEMFRARNHAPDIAPKAEGILDKIAEFFRAMGRAFRTSGFKRTSDIFNEIEQGRIGARERGEIRTLRELDRLPPQLIDAPIAQEFEEGEAPPIGEPTDVTSVGQDGGIVTPVTTFEDVEADTESITGLVISPTGRVDIGDKIYNRRDLTIEELQEQRDFLIKNLGGRHRDSLEVLEWLTKNAPGKDYKAIAERLLAQMKKFKKLKKINFQFRIIEKGDQRLNIRGHKGSGLNWLGVSYYPETYEGELRQQIYINYTPGHRSSFAPVKQPDGTIKRLEYADGAGGVDFETILHEFTHQATQAATSTRQSAARNDPKTNEAINELETIRKKLEKILNEKERAGEKVDQYVKYGTKNIQELLAVGFTDREFQKFMESVPYSPRGKKTLWDKFTESIRKLLGIPAKQDTAFSEFLLQAGRITNLSQKQIRSTLATSDFAGGFDVTLPMSESMPAYGEATNVRATRNRLVRELEDSGLVGVEAVPLDEIVDSDLQELSPESRNLVKALRRDDWLGFDNMDSLMSSIFDEGLNRFNPSVATKRALGRYVNLNFGGAGSAEMMPTLDDSLNTLRQQIINKEPLTTEQKAIQEEINELKNDLNPLESEMRQEGSEMSERNRRILDQKINKIERQISGLEEQFRAVKKEPTSPKQLALFSRKKRFAKATDRINLYHGTTKDFDEIQGSTSGIYGRGSYLTSSTSKADVYADENILIQPVNEIEGIPDVTEGAKVIPVTISNDLKLANNTDYFLAKATAQIRLGISELFGKESTDNKYLTAKAANKRRIMELADDILEFERGYDGKFINDEYIIYDPSNIESALSPGERAGTEPVTSAEKQLIEATEKAEEIVKNTPRGDVPHYNVNASDVALKAAIDFNEDIAAKAPIRDIPNYSRGSIPTEFEDSMKNIGYYQDKTMSLGATLLDVINDPVENVRKAFKDFRQNYIDKLDKVEKKILQGSMENEDVRLANNSADTSTMAAMRLADKARGVFQGMLMRGYVTDEIDGIPSLTNVEQLEIDTKYNPFIDGDKGTGGLMQFMSPLYADPTVDLEAVFALYAKINRVKTMEDNGRVVDSPVTAKDKEHLETIRRKYPVVIEVYNNYQKWNNKLIEFATSKGLLNEEQSAMWREHSSYYPFYRDMVDEKGLAAPTIGGGSLPSNPLNIKMEGSKEAIEVNPVEAIARNSLSILTGAMKNDGSAKLLRDLASMKEARPVTAKEKKEGNLNTIFVFENGQKQYYEVDDIELFHGIQAIGGVKTDAVTKFLAFPSSLLRDTVTRDPGFVIVNLLRDTLSTTITSGAPLGGEGFTPIIDTFKNMFADMSNLEKFGVIGGYDFQNDEGSVAELMTRARREQGLTPDNGITPESAFYTVWDGLGALTTKSDGATRLAVYNAVYNDMKKRGFNEAQAQSEAAYQSLEIINFGRRGLSPLFRVITAAIPFLNARIQGLDVLYRSATGKYSSIDKLEEGETLEDFQRKVIRKFATRAGTMVALTALYYLLVSDTDEYKEVKREVRDDNWLIPTGLGYTVKIPIPFEVGMLFKAIPERLIDAGVGALGGEQVELSPGASIYRQIGTSAEIPFITSGDIGIQALKPLFEATINRNSFTDTELVPYYKLKEEPAYQARQSTNEVARLLGEALNISPIKIEHVLTGYTGTLGGYVLDIMDVFARSVSGTPLMPPNINDIPVIKRLLIDQDKAGGLQQQFYELRNVVDGAVLTLNDLKEQKRFDEMAAFREHNKGVFQVRGQVRALNRYMDNWRKKRDRLLRRDDISPLVKSDILRQMELDRDKRLAILPALKERADIPSISLFN